MEFGVGEGADSSTVFEIIADSYEVERLECGGSGAKPGFAQSFSNQGYASFILSEYAEKG